MSSQQNIVIDGMELRPEIELLLCAARVHPGETQVQRMHTLLQQAIDWHALRRISYRNRVQVLLYLSLKSTSPELVPQDVYAHLQDRFRSTTAYNLFLTRELINLLDCLNAQGIRALPYKGPVLAHTIYGNVALRQFGDLDILVPERDAIKAKEILCAGGFLQTWPEAGLTPGQEIAHLKTKYNYKLVRESDNLEVELHWRVTPCYLNVPPKAELLWRRLESITLAGQALLCFPAEEQLLILCVHGANHCWTRLGWICDIAELIHGHPGLDWAHLLALARSWRSERMLFIGLFLAQTLLEAKIPTAVSRRVQADRLARKLARKSFQWLFSDQYMPFPPFAEPTYHLQMRSHWQDKIHYCLQILYPSSRDWSSGTLPRPLHSLYYLLRPIRLGIDHGLKLRHRSKQN